MARSTKSDSTLRLLLWVCFLLSFAFAIPYAVCLDGITPAIGLIFLAISCAASLVDRKGIFALLRGYSSVILGPKYEYSIVLGDDSAIAEDDGNLPVSLTTSLVFDSILAFIHALIFSITIVEMCEEWRYNHSEILGTFASLPYLTALIIHTILALKAAYKLSKESRIKAATPCPHCHKLPREPVNQQETARVFSDDGGPKMSGASVGTPDFLSEA